MAQPIDATSPLGQEFARRAPWVTRFHIGGASYGGHYDAGTDQRLDLLHAQFPQARRILELGCLEGGHSFALAARPQVEQVVAVEGRAASLERARFVQRALGVEHAGKVSFVQANVERDPLTPLGAFDAVLCLGVLYHLPRPWTLLAEMRRAAPATLLWTHVAPEGARLRLGGYRGRLYPEWRFLWEPLSGLSAYSFWPTRSELLRMLADAGYARSNVLHDDPHHEHGPAITIAAC